TSGDGRAALPANYAYVAGDNGVHVFMGVTLGTVGNQTITVTDTAAAAITGNVAIRVTPGAATQPVVTPAANLTLAGAPLAFTVTAQDRFGNTATGYLGTVRITSNDGAAVLPANYTFVAADNGVHVFFGANAATLNTVGARTLTATDTVNGA